jgi:xanthine dehydrogenase accessory factor
MIDIYEECLRLLTAGEAVVIATVFEAKGSAPRTAGAKMIVRADASIKGTIGGGRLEHDAIMAACNLFHTKNSSIYAFDLTGTDVAGMDMICGGRGEVWLHYLDNQIENNQTVCRATIELLKEQKKGWLITELTATLPSQDRQYALLCGDESMAGYLHIDREKINILLTASETCGVYTETIGSMRFLVEAIRPAHSVFVFGAGHVSMQVVPLCQNFDAGPTDSGCLYRNDRQST